jgi:hypothetical protein
MVAMTATDGKLFGVGRDQAIYCREDTLVDLVWSRIAPPPIPGGATLSLTAYYGRLYALADPQPPTRPGDFPQQGGSFRGIGGSIDSPEQVGRLNGELHSFDSPQQGDRLLLDPYTVTKPVSYTTLSRGLYWRTATSVYGAINPDMLFIDDYNGFAIGTLEGSGYFTTTGVGTLPINLVYSQVTRVARDVVLFYEHLSQHSWLYRFYADGTTEEIQEDDWGERWDHIVYVHPANSSEPERLFFYRADGDGNSVGMIGRFIADENDEWHFVVEEHRSDYGRWDVITTTWAGRLVFYDRQLGAVEWVTSTVLAILSMRVERA